VKEIFASGTAAVHIPRGKLAYREKLRVNQGKVGPAQKLYDTIMGIQYGKNQRPLWMDGESNLMRPR